MIYLDSLLVTFHPLCFIICSFDLPLSPCLSQSRRTPLYICWCSNCPRFGQWEYFRVALASFYHIFITFLRTSLPSGRERCSRLTHTMPGLASATSPKSLGLLVGIKSILFNQLHDFSWAWMCGRDHMPASSSDGCGNCNPKISSELLNCDLETAPGPRSQPSILSIL